MASDFNAPPSGANARGGGNARGGANARGGGNARGGANARGGGNPRGARAAAPGFFNLLFGPDGSTIHEPPLVMQGEEEVIFSQNAPGASQDPYLYDEGWPDDLHDFLSL